MKLRRYLLGLSLVALTAPQETSLREGGELVADSDRPAEWNAVEHSGKRTKADVAHKTVKTFAEAAARAFGVGADKQATFDTKKAREEAGKSKQERKKKGGKTDKASDDAEQTEV